MGSPFFGPALGYQPEILKAALTPWDKIVLAGIELTLVRAVRAHKAGRFNILLVPGMSGAQLMYLGDEPAEIEVHLEVWTAEQMSSWETVAPLLRPRHGKAGPRAVDVAYPALAQVGIRKLYPSKLGVLEPTGRNGVFQTRFSFLQFSPLIAVGVKKVDASSTTSTGPQQQPADPSTNPTTTGPK